MLSLRGSILLSAFFHAVLFVAFLLASGTGGAKVVYKPRYQVRLVRPQEVSSLTKPQKKVAKPTPPPKVAKPKPKKVVVPEQKKEAPKKPPEKKVAKKPDRKPAPVEKPREPAPEEVLEEALARIKKKATSREENAPAESSGWEERQKEIEYSAYYDQVERAVRENWIPPQDMDFGEDSEMTVVSLTLLPDGRVLKSYIEEPSGDPLFDQSVMRAILKSTPFPPPPIGLKQQSFELGLRFHSTPQRP